jgi:hypothetical protein
MKFNYNLLSLIAIIAWSSVSYAQQTVLTAADSGPGSLREAISTSAAGEEIIISNDLNGSMIILNTPLVISQPVTIVGNASSRTSVQAQIIFDNAGSVSLSNMTFSGNTAVSGGAIMSINTDLKIFNSTFSDNVATGDMATQGGGAIAVSGGSLYAQNCEFNNNSATGASGSGGAIINTDGGMLRLVRSSFTGNSASRAGGAIEDVSGASTTLNFFQIDFDGNTAGAAPGNGGAFHITGPGNVTVFGGTVENNVAAAEGGGFWNGAGRMDLKDVRFINNEANGNDADQGGGGLYNLSGEVVITGSTVFRDNRALGISGSGGGILNDVGGMIESYRTRFEGNQSSRAGGGVEDVSGPTTTLRFADVRMEANSTGNNPGNGGGFHITGPGNVEFHRGVVNNNTAGAEGGGLWNGSGSMLVLGTRITGNTASGDAANEGGGGIFNAGGTLKVDNNAEISGNVADGASGSGGGILNGELGTMSIVKAVIRNNTASRAGGGIEDNSGPTTSFNLFEVTLRDNTTGPAPGNGGGLHISSGGDARIFGGVVVGNSAAREGGGLWNDTGSMSVDGTSINNNTAAGDAADDGGGGIFNNGGTLLLTNEVTISDNDATGASGSGGGLFNAVGGTIQAFDVNIARNTANRAGGGFEDASGAATTVEFFNVNIVDNTVFTSPGNGGGVHISGDGNMTLKDCNIDRNEAGREGGGLWNGTGDMLVFDCSIEENVGLGNEANQGGGGAFNNGGFLAFFDGCRIQDNSATGTSGSGGGILNNDGGRLEITGTRIARNSASRAGGGIEDTSDESVIITDSDISENVTGSAPGNGGGLHVTGSATVTITDTDVKDNVAAAEGGGLWHGTGIMNVSNTLIKDNVANGMDADQGGAGIYVLSGALNISDSEVSENVATNGSGSGGGLLLDAGSNAVITNVNFRANEAARAGGAIEDNSGATTTVEVTDCSVRDNFAGASPGNGGGIHITGPGNMDVTGGEYRNNVAAAEGGALWNGSGTMNVVNVSVRNNVAKGSDPTQGGGGLFNNGGTLNVTTSTVAFNRSENGGLGGGINNAGSGTMTITASTISSNRSEANAGGMVNTGTMTINRSTIARNSSDNFGGGIGQAAGAVSVTLSNTIVAENSAPNRGDNVDIASTGSYISNGYNLIESDDANVFTPTSTDLEGVDARLRGLNNNGGLTMTHAIGCESPARDAGDPANNMADQRGLPVVGQRDIGAFERQASCFTSPQPTPTTAAVSTFNVYPTVSRGEAVVVETDFTEETFTYQLMDASGHVLREMFATGEKQMVELNGLVPGNYYLRKVTQAGVETKLITIAR